MVADLWHAIADLSPRERIQLLERSCSSASLPLPGQASPAFQYPRLCPLTRLVPCVAILGSPSGHMPGNAQSTPSTQSKQQCNVEDTIVRKTVAGGGSV